MFIFKRKKSAHPSTILIDGIAALTSDQLIVDSIWQQNQTITHITDVMSKSIVDPSDPLDAALMQYINAHAISMPQYKPFHTITFDQHRGVSGNIWHHGTNYVPSIKGMPESILAHCDMSDNERESIQIRLHAMSATGNIIIAVAAGLLSRSIKNLDQLKRNEKLTFVGFISFKPTISIAAKQLLAQGSTSIYLATGQHPDTTHAIVKELGLANSPQDVFDARRLDVMNASEVKTTVASVKIFARATPDNKARILHALEGSDRTTTRVTTTAELQKLLAN